MALVLIDIALIAWAFNCTRRYREAKRWTPVEGVIVDSQVEKYRELSVYAILEYLRPHIRHEYEVNGTKHIGSRVSFERRNEIFPAGNKDIYWQSGCRERRWKCM